ncbi:MAG: hypothetical protein AAFQ74_08005 [Cyanobacteria bacterium J06623_4]
MKHSSEKRRFAICVSNENCDDLQILKIYQVLPDPGAAEESYIHVVDDSGEDYLYPSSCFVNADFPEMLTQQLIAAVPSLA